MSKILMTGITGLVGSAVAAELLASDPQLHIVALTRGQGNKNAQERVEETLREQFEFDGRPELAEEAITRVTTIQRNIASPLASDEINSLKGIDKIFHCAANVNLGKDPYGITYRSNYQGTKNMLQTAKALGIKTFHQVSTAYVAGKHVGVAKEDGLIPNIDFHNAYEKSKYNSETLTRESGLEYSIYRPSIIVGRLSDGKIRKPLAFYRILEFFAKLKKQQCVKHNIKPYEKLDVQLKVHVTPSDKIYFVPIDYVQKSIATLFLLPPQNKTYHITGNGPGSVMDIEKAVQASLQITGLGIAAPGDKMTIKEKIIHKFIGDLLPYFESQITFDVTNTRNALGDEMLNWKVDADKMFIIVNEYFKNAFPEIIAQEKH